MLTDPDLFALLDTHAPWRPVPLVASLSAWHADDELPLWHALEQASGQVLSPPFFCVPWPGAQALAKVMLEGIVDVRGRRIADVGGGSGLAACAGLRAGASAAQVCEIDPLAARAAVELGRRHSVDIAPLIADALSDPSIVQAADVVLAGDVVYGEAQRDLFARALTAWRDRGQEVLVADSGRPFFDASGLTPLFAIEVPTPRSLDGASGRLVTVYRA